MLLQRPPLALGVYCLKNSMPGQVKTFRLAKRNITSEEGQRAEVQQERPSGVHSRRVPVIQHAEQLKDDVIFQHPLEQWRKHSDDEPDPAKQAGKESTPFTCGSPRCRRRLWHFLPRRRRRSTMALWKLDDVCHRPTSPTLTSLESDTDGVPALSAPSSRKRLAATLTLLKYRHALAAKKFQPAIFYNPDLQTFAEIDISGIFLLVITRS